MRGGAGHDSVSYEFATKPVTVDLDGASRDDGQAGEYDTVGADVEDVVGGSGADRITGNNAANGLFAGGGVDIVHGGGGNDTIDGGNGADWLYGDAGDDSLDGFEDHPYADHLDGGVNAATGDECVAGVSDVKVNCER
jgi:serralysin